MWEIQNKKTIEQIKQELINNNAHITNKENGGEFYLKLLLKEIDNLISEFKHYKNLKKHWKTILLPDLIEKITATNLKIKERIDTYTPIYQNAINAIPKDPNFLNYQMSYNHLMFFDKVQKYVKEWGEKIFNLEKDLKENKKEINHYKTTPNIFTRNHKGELLEIESEKIEKITSRIFHQLQINGLTDVGKIKINEILGNLSEEEKEDHFKDNENEQHWTSTK